jgi:hypothetical protein
MVDDIMMLHDRGQNRKKKERREEGKTNREVVVLVVLRLIDKVGCMVARMELYMDVNYT